MIFVNILAWNGERWLKGCLDSVFASEGADFKVLVVDNGSSDRSAEIVEKDYPQALLVRNAANLGFAEGNNVGIRYALDRGADQVVLLNQDVTVDRQWLSQLLSAAETEREFQIFAPLQYDYEGRELDRLFLRGMLDMSPEFAEDYKKGEGFRKIYPLPTALGAAVLIKKEVFLKAGGFDPFYFVYHEETDLFQRCAYHGFRIALAPGSRINHWHGSLHPEEMALRSRYLTYRNKLVLMLKDPRISVFSGLLACFSWSWQFAAENAGPARGFLRIALVAWLQLLVLYYLPLIAYKRFREKRGACYL